MTFVSFAQNGEDVILWRALKDIDKGFYIDAGANDPVTDSVTKAFYDRGWRGINIEPVRYWHERLVADRPEDINLCLAVGERAGLATIHEIPDTGLSTMSAEVAATHQRSGRTSTPTLVPVLRLDDICATHAPSDIHFLKIDVEGVEEQVLCGLDLNRWRPWILVIEATFPNSPEAQHQAWESMVLERDYRFAYFDGLSRYYVADEKAELIPRLGVQPNVFDDFARAREQAQIAALDARTSELAQLRQELEQCQRVWRESEEAHRRAREEADEAHRSELAALRQEHEQYQREWQEADEAHRNELTALRQEHEQYQREWQEADEAHRNELTALRQELQRREHTHAEELTRRLQQMASLRQENQQRAAEQERLLHEERRRSETLRAQLAEASSQVGGLRRRALLLERDLSILQGSVPLHLLIALRLRRPLDGTAEGPPKTPAAWLGKKLRRKAHKLRRRVKKSWRRLLGRKKNTSNIAVGSTVVPQLPDSPPATAPETVRQEQLARLPLSPTAQRAFHEILDAARLQS